MYSYSYEVLHGLTCSSPESNPLSSFSHVQLRSCLMNVTGLSQSRSRLPLAPF